MALPPSIVIDDYTFTYIDKFISRDWIYVKLKSQSDAGTEEPYEFVVYKSNSQGLWRYYAHSESCNPCKFSDYTVTTLIDFRLQTYINTHLDNIAKIDKQYELESTLVLNVSDFIDKQRIAYQHDFGVIFHLFQKANTDCVNMPELEKIELDHIIPDEEESKYIETKADFFTLFTEKEKSNDNYYKIDVLDKISVFIEARFILHDNPEYVTTIARNVIHFKYARMKDGNIKPERTTAWGKKIYKYLAVNYINPQEILYPFSKDINIFYIIIQHKNDNSKYRLFYMQYSIEGDDTVYYMPVCITPENTRITKYGLADKYCPSGLYCNKPWDYLKQCFFKKSNKTKKQICRAPDNYAFIGNNYVDLWPFNTKTILTKSVPAKHSSPVMHNKPDPGTNTPATGSNPMADPGTNTPATGLITKTDPGTNTPATGLITKTDPGTNTPATESNPMGDTDGENPPATGSNIANIQATGLTGPEINKHPHTQNTVTTKRTSTEHSGIPTQTYSTINPDKVNFINLV